MTHGSAVPGAWKETSSKWNDCSTQSHSRSFFLAVPIYPGPSHLICFGQERAIRGVYIFQCKTGILGIHDKVGTGLLFPWCPSCTWAWITHSIATTLFPPLYLHAFHKWKTNQLKTKTTPFPLRSAIVPSHEKQNSSARNACIPLVICFSQDLLSTQHPTSLKCQGTFMHSRTNQTQKTSRDLHLQISRLISDTGQLEIVWVLVVFFFKEPQWMSCYTIESSSIFHNNRKISSKEETEKDWTLPMLQTGFPSFLHILPLDPEMIHCYSAGTVSGLLFCGEG